MPWTVKDVDSKKKGLTPAQKKKWVKIANGVLKDCQAKRRKGPKRGSAFCRGRVSCSCY
jgi:uncharacterized protein YdaT